MAVDSYRQSYDQKLWKSFRNGDEEALEGLFGTYYSVLLNYGHKFTLNTYMIEESVQDLFVKLWNTRRLIGSTANVKHYLFKAYRSILFRKLQKQAANVMEKLDDEKYDFKIELAPDQKMMEMENDAELRQKIDAGLESLTARQREAVYLRFYEDLSYEEVSEILNLNIGGTYKLIYRALERLKDKLGPVFLGILLSGLRLHSLFLS
jgi:RNA polymerase sigma factor (sigma-70 family)